MGWKPCEFWSSSMGEFYHSYRGYSLAHERKWEQTRLITAAIINQKAQKPEDIVKVEDIIKLSFDEEAARDKAEWIKSARPSEEEIGWLKRKGLIKK